MDYTREQILAKLQEANAAGDKERARVLAGALEKMAQAQAQQGPQGAAPQTQDQGLGNAIRHGLQQGATFGFADEFSAGGRALLDKYVFDKLDPEYASDASLRERYEMYRDDERSQIAAGREHHGGAMFASELVPGLLQGGAGLGKAIGGGGLKQNLGRLAGVGAGYGGVAGAGYGQGEGAGGIAKDAATGAAFGAGLGVGLPVAGAGIKRGVQNVARRFGAGTEGVKNAAHEAARREILRDLKRDGLTAKEAETLLAHNRQFMLGDLGDNLRAQGENVMNQPGAGGAKLKEILGARAEKTFDRVMPALREGIEQSHLVTQGMRVPQNYAKAEKAIITRAREMTKDLWDVAYSPNFKPTPWLKNLMFRKMKPDGTLGPIKDRMMRAADRDAEEVLKLRIRTGEIMPDDPGMMARYFDEVQRALRDRIKMGKRGTVEMGDRVMTKLDAQHRRFIKEMEQTMPPEWKAARKLWAGEGANKDAFDAGQKLFSSYADDISMRLDDMVMSERDNYLVGALRAIENKLARKVATGDILRDLRETKQGKDLMRTVFGGQKGFERFMSMARDEETMAKFFQKTQGSQTFGRQAKHADAGGAVGTLAGMWMGMNLGVAGVPLLGRYVGRKATNLMSAADEHKRNAMAQMLRTRNPRALEQQMQKPLLPISPMLGTLGLGSATQLPGLLDQ